MDLQSRAAIFPIPDIRNGPFWIEPGRIVWLLGWPSKRDRRCWARKSQRGTRARKNIAMLIVLSIQCQAALDTV